MVLITTDYDISEVQFKNGKIHKVWHQKGASNVRHIPVSALEKHYVALLAKLNADSD